MIHMLLHALFGLVIGLVARAVLPGADHHGLIVTSIIGMVGGWLGGQLGRWFGWYKEGHAAGFLMSVVGAVILLLILRFVS
jgi:uncharacterized membrane protein YeaQ/YmgE (transglycosylase-associated protein family)